MIIELTELQSRTRPCPDTWTELVAAGRLTGDGRAMDIPDAEFAAAVSKCPTLEGIRGLGDLMHLVLHPVAKAVDAVAGTDLKNCGGCNQRRDNLNEFLPL